VPQIEVAFDINADGILNVSAQDKATGHRQNITIQASSGLSDGEIEQMVQDAEKYGEEDSSRKESVEASNDANSAIYGAERALKELSEHSDLELQDTVKDKLQELKQVLEEADLETIRKSTDALQQEVQRIAALAYTKTQGEMGDESRNDNNTNQSHNDEDVVSSNVQEA
jgi:molecular chaperone DnaK